MFLGHAYRIWDSSLGLREVDHNTVPVARQHVTQPLCFSRVAKEESFMTAGAVQRVPTPQTIDEVVEQLDAIIDWARRERSRVGYFAALYRGVTVRVHEGITAGRFEDGALMERLDVAFANRYLEAVAQYRRGEPTTRVWKVAFEGANSWRPIVLQHLLLGINAHINLDLGIACAQVAPADTLPGLQRDFDAINAILSSMIDEVQDKLGRVWPYMRICDLVGCRTDEAIFNFSVRRARDAAWGVAARLAPLDAEQAAKAIDEVDQEIALLARLIRRPGIVASTGLLLVRVAEKNDIDQIIGHLL